MAYTVLTEQELLELAKGRSADRREQVEKALNKAEAEGWIFVGVDASDSAGAVYVFRSAEGRLRLGNIR